MTATQPTLFDLDPPDATARPTPEPESRHWAWRVPSSPAADAWGDECSVAQRRRDSRRILAGRALKMVAEGHAADCRAAWRIVRRRYEAGVFTLPANV